MVESFTLYTVLAASLVLTSFATNKNTSKPFSILCGLLAGLLLTTTGVLLLTGFAYDVSYQTNSTIANYTVNESTYSPAGVLGNFTIKQVPVITSTNKTITRANVVDTLTQAIAVLFILGGLAEAILTAFSIYEGKNDENEDD